MNYLIQFGENTLYKTFKCDDDAITFCEYIINEYEFTGITIMKEIPYEDHLGSGFYWGTIWNNK